MFENRPIVIHFLNVGHGDCSIIEHPSGRTTVVDINNSGVLDGDTAVELAENEGVARLVYEWVYKAYGWDTSLLRSYSDKLTDPVSFLRARGHSSIFRFIATHPDLDHLSGLHRLRQTGIEILKFWDTNNAKRFTLQELLQMGSSFSDWQEYRRLQTGPVGTRFVGVHRGEQGNYWTGDGIHVLSPTPALVAEANKRSDWNLLSYVLRIQWGKSVVILGGDATEEAWQDIWLKHDDSFLKASILKASHHGRDTAYHQKAVAAMSPTFTIVSVGKKPDNDATNKYRHYSGKVLSTRHCGDITAYCWEDGRIFLFDSQSQLIDYRIPSLSWRPL